MAISVNYPSPVYVNGYACNNCAQVAEAKQDINPADPQAGPGGIDAKNNPQPGQSPAVIFGGVLASGAASASDGTNASSSNTTSPGQSWSLQTPSAGSSGTPGLGGLLNISI